MNHTKRSVPVGTKVRQSADFLAKIGARPDATLYTVLHCDCVPCVQGRWVAIDFPVTRELAWRHIHVSFVEVVKVAVEAEAEE